MGFAKVGEGYEVTKASEHRRTPSNKKRRGIRILMPAPSVSDFRHIKPPHMQRQFVDGAERSNACPIAMRDVPGWDGHPPANTAAN
jgi:hypothetical protein